MADPTDNGRKLAEAARLLGEAARTLGSIGNAAASAAQRAVTALPKQEQSPVGRALGALMETGLGKRLADTGIGRAVSNIRAGWEGGRSVADAYYGASKAGHSAAAGAAATGDRATAGAGAALTGIAGKLLPVAGAAVAVGDSLNKLRKYIHETAEAALTAQRKYAEVSGSMAAVFAEFDVKQTLRDIRHGEATAASTRRVADSVSARREALEPLRQEWENLSNNMTASVNNFLTKIEKPILELCTKVVKEAGAVADMAKDAADKLAEAAGVGKGGDEISSLHGIRDRINADAAAAQARARESLERMRDDARKGSGGP